MQRLVVKVLDSMRRFRILPYRHRQRRRGCKRPRVEQHLSVGVVVNIFPGLGDVQDAWPAMCMNVLLGMRWNDYVEHSRLVILQDHAMIPWRGLNGVLCGSPKTFCLRRSCL